MIKPTWKLEWLNAVLTECYCHQTWCAWRMGGWFSHFGDHLYSITFFLFKLMYVGIPTDSSWCKMAIRDGIIYPSVNIFTRQINFPRDDNLSFNVKQMFQLKVRIYYLVTLNVLIFLAGEWIQLFNNPQNANNHHFIIYNLNIFILHFIFIFFSQITFKSSELQNNKTQKSITPKFDVFGSGGNVLRIEAWFSFDRRPGWNKNTAFTPDVLTVL